MRRVKERMEESRIEICGSGRCVHSDKQSGLEVKEAHLEGKVMLLGLYKLGL